MILILKDKNCKIEFEINKSDLEKSNYFEILFSGNFKEKIIDNKFELQVDNAVLLYLMLQPQLNNDIDITDEIKKMSDYYMITNIIENKARFTNLINFIELNNYNYNNRIMDEIIDLADQFELKLKPKQKLVLENIVNNYKILICDGKYNISIFDTRTLKNNLIYYRHGISTIKSIFYHDKDNKIIYESRNTSKKYYLDTKEKKKITGKYSPVANNTIRLNFTDQKLVVIEDNVKEENLSKSILARSYSGKYVFIFNFSTLFIVDVTTNEKIKTFENLICHGYYQNIVYVGDDNSNYKFHKFGKIIGFSKDDSHLFIAKNKTIEIEKIDSKHVTTLNIETNIIAANISNCKKYIFVVTKNKFEVYEILSSKLLFFKFENINDKDKRYYVEFSDDSKFVLIVSNNILICDWKNEKIFKLEQDDIYIATFINEYWRPKLQQIIDN